MGLAIALLTISDTRTLADDASGDQLHRSLEQAGTVCRSGSSAPMTDTRSARN